MDEVVDRYYREHPEHQPGTLECLLYDAFVAGRLSERGGMPGVTEWAQIKMDFKVWRARRIPLPEVTE